MLKFGVIEPSTLSYASPIVVVRKADGSNKTCVDFRKLNEITVLDPEPMPKPEQIFSKLKVDQYFPTFDVTKGYWQIPMTDEEYMALSTHKGLHQFKVLPFRLVTAPATINQVFRKLLYRTEKLDNYVDYMPSHIPNWQGCITVIRPFLPCDAMLAQYMPSPVSVCHTLVSYQNG